MCSGMQLTCWRCWIGCTMAKMKMYYKPNGNRRHWKIYCKCEWENGGFAWCKCTNPVHMLWNKLDQNNESTVSLNKIFSNIKDIIRCEHIVVMLLFHLVLFILHMQSFRKQILDFLTRWHVEFDYTESDATNKEWTRIAYLDTFIFLLCSWFMAFMTIFFLVFKL